MPIYSYECQTCKQLVEKLETYSAESVRDCDICGSIKSSRRIISKSSFVLSGPGWAKQSYTKS